MMLVSVVLYLILVCFAIYFFIVADPKESPIARYVTIILPKDIYAFLKRKLHPRILYVIEFYIIDRALMLTYCTVFYAGASIVFIKVYPLAGVTFLSSYHKLYAIVTFLSCIASWRMVCRTSPGIITSRNIQLYNHYPYDDLLFVDGITCRTTNIVKLARSKFDRCKYQNNIARYDHYCGWVCNTIGEENYRWFLLFVAVHVFMMGYSTYGFSEVFRHEIRVNNLLNATYYDRVSGTKIQSTKWIVVQYLFHHFMAECSILIISAVMFVFLLCFLLYHCYLTSYNITTNEAAKWDQIKRWYQKELRKYNTAIKNGTIQPQSSTKSKQLVNDNNTNSMPMKVVDGDVTCTGMTESNNGIDEKNDNDTNSNNKENDDDDERIRHPGPKPINIYDRGFIENWKEVIFPISLRKLNETKKIRRQQQRQIERQRKNE